jgi:hypothetical protein
MGRAPAFFLRSQKPLSVRTIRAAVRSWDLTARRDEQECRPQKQ